MTTIAADFWWWWLLTIAITFAGPELWFIARARGGQQWTLSDCIRRWASVHHWLPPVVWGGSVFLLVHWFGG